MNYKSEYEKWLNSNTFDEETKYELKSLKDEKEIEDRFYKNLSFGTAGMRGIIGAGTNRMNVYNVKKATQALANYLNKNEKEKEKGVVIAYDSRKYSDYFALNAALTLCANDIKVMLFDELRPVPILSYAISHLKTAAGIVITASHNPPQYNGYKLYGPDGAQIGPEFAEEITKEIDNLEYEDCKTISKDNALQMGLLKYIGDEEVDNDYMKMLHHLVVNPNIIKEYGKQLNIVYSPLHGSGNKPVRRILKEIGIENVYVVKEQENPDPNFSTVEVPNPEDPKAFKMAIDLAKKVNANCAFATDPDCDRLGVAIKEENGEFTLLNGNQIACLMLEYILNSLSKNNKLPKNGAVVKSIVSTELSRRICESYNVAQFETLTGFKYIGEMIDQFENTNDYKFLFGFEESYGYLSGVSVRDKDAVNASMLLAETACYYFSKNMTLSQAMTYIYEKYGYYKDKVISKVLPGKDGAEKMDKIMQKMHTSIPESIGGYKVLALRDYLNGYRTDAITNAKEKINLPKSDVLYYELEGNNWICVRPSGTEPKIKLYINSCGKSEKEALEIIDVLSKACDNMLV